jgi:hypothetical protein
MSDNTDEYEDIINLPHHVSKRHPQMSMQARAAQFAPFAAVSGHGDATRETELAHTVDEELEFEEEDI